MRHRDKSASESGPRFDCIEADILDENGLWLYVRLKCEKRHSHKSCSMMWPFTKPHSIRQHAHINREPCSPLKWNSTAGV